MYISDISTIVQRLVFFFSQKLSKVIKYQNPSNMSISDICTIDLQKTPTTMRSNPCNRGTLYVILYGQNDLGQQLVFFSPKNQNPSKMYISLSDTCRIEFLSCFTSKRI